MLPMNFAVRNLWMTAGFFCLVFVHGAWAGIVFSDNVPADQRILLEKDLQALDRMGVNASDEALKSVLKQTTITPSALRRWLEKRVHYVVGEDYDFSDNAYASKVEVVYPTFQASATMPDFLPPLPSVGEGKGPVVTVMQNLSGAFYALGRDVERAVLADIPGVREFIPVSSIRVGIIQIGEGLFVMSKKMPELREDAFLYTARRLSVLFHEARHSDGRGESLGFSHSRCPPGHELEGHFACDFNLNGAYTVSSLVLKNFASNCRGCRTKEAEILKVIALDHHSRVIRSMPTFDFPTQTRLKALRAQLFGCENAKLLSISRGPVASGLCTEDAKASSRREVRSIYAAGLKSFFPTPRSARVLDETPEMLELVEKD